MTRRLILAGTLMAAAVVGVLLGRHLRAIDDVAVDSGTDTSPPETAEGIAGRKPPPMRTGSSRAVAMLAGNPAAYLESLHALPEGELPHLVDRLRQSRETRDQFAVRLALLEWLRTDPEAVIDAILSGKGWDPHLEGFVAHSLAQRDLARAVKFGLSLNERSRSGLGLVAAQAARQFGGQGWALFDALDPKPDDIWGPFLSAWMEEEPIKALQWHADYRRTHPE